MLQEMESRKPGEKGRRREGGKEGRRREEGEEEGRRGGGGKRGRREEKGGENSVIVMKLIHNLPSPITPLPFPPPSHSSTLSSIPPHLEHSPDVLSMCGAGEARGFVAHSLHQRFCCLCHLSHLLCVRQTTLLLTHCVRV